MNFSTNQIVYNKKLLVSDLVIGPSEQDSLYGFIIGHFSLDYLSIIFYDFFKTGLVDTHEGPSEPI